MSRATHVVRIAIAPERASEEHAYLTHFQRDGGSRARARVVRVTCASDDTIATVKAKVRELTGEDVEILRRGGTKSGVVMEDGKTVEECGVSKDFGAWEHWWVDSAARAKRAAADREKILSYINVTPNEMTPKVLRALREMDVSAMR